MKKIIALTLAVVILLCCFCACSNGKSDKNAILTSTPWVSLYSSTTLTFHDDHSMSIGASKGTWSREDDLITITYTVSDGSSMEMSLDLIQDENGSFLRNREIGKQNGTVFNWTVHEYYPEETAAQMKASLAKNLGETVSTDILDLTMEKAEFCYFASSSRDQLWATPSAEDKGGIFKTNKGRTFVAMTFTVKNNDRQTLDIAESMGDGWNMNWKMIYHNTTYNIRSFDLNNKDGGYGLDLGFAAVSTDGSVTFKPYDSMNYLLDAGKSITIRVLGIVGMEPDSLTDGFDLVVNVLNSDSNDEEFIYRVG